MQFLENQEKHPDSLCWAKIAYIDGIDFLQIQQTLILEYFCAFPKPKLQNWFCQKDSVKFLSLKPFNFRKILLPFLVKSFLMTHWLTYRLIVLILKDNFCRNAEFWKQLNGQHLHAKCIFKLIQRNYLNFWNLILLKSWALANTCIVFAIKKPAL